MEVIGIDPGLNGAIASWDGLTLNLLSVPTLKAKSRGREVNWEKLYDDFYSIFDPEYLIIDNAFIERVHAMPRQGVSSMFKFGYIAGGLRMLVAGYRIPITLVTPQKWKKAMGLSSSKDEARALASELFPDYASAFARKKDDGVAEAALIAYYGYRLLRGEQE